MRTLSPPWALTKLKSVVPSSFTFTFQLNATMESSIESNPTGFCKRMSTRPGDTRFVPLIFLKVGDAAVHEFFHHHLFSHALLSTHIAARY